MRPNDFDEAIKGLSRGFRRAHDGLRSQQDHVVRLLDHEQRLKEGLAKMSDKLIRYSFLLNDAATLLIEAVQENSDTNEHTLGGDWQQRASQFLQKLRDVE